MPSKGQNVDCPNQDGWSKNIDMEEIRALGSPIDHSQTPRPSDFSHNPPLSQSQHNPEGGFLKEIDEMFAHPNSNGSIFIQAGKVKTLTQLLAIEKIACVQTLSTVERINKRLVSFEECEQK